MNSNIEYGAASSGLPFYKKNKESSIDNIKIQYLLEATPFRRKFTYNFGKRLTEETFFNEFYTEMWQPEDDEEVCEKNRTFDSLIRNELVSMDNPDEKVSLFHLWGYAGCGKTTYVRHLLWELCKQKKLRYHVVNFENCEQIGSALESKVSELLSENFSGTVNYLNQLANDELFAIGAFDRIKTFLKSFATYTKEYVQINLYGTQAVLRILQTIKKAIEDQLKLPTIEMESVEENVTPYSIYIDFLLTLLFFICIYKVEESDNKGDKIVILFDNVDSIRNLNEEYILLTSIMNFLNASHLFLELNFENDRRINGRLISEILDEMKYSIFLTTRVVTVKRFRELKPDFEDYLGWDNHEMPEYFYNHETILYKKMDYYRRAEGNRKDSVVLRKLEGVYDLSKYVYRSSSFKKLFNGNIRFCFSTLCYMYDKFYNTTLLEDCKRLNKEYDNKNSPAGHGANGIVLAMVLDYFKENEVFSKKLHLSTCSQDNKISLSRIVLTILHENDGKCSLLDIFESIPPQYVDEKLCECIWDLSERERHVWRRLLAFERKIPESEEALELQCKQFKNGEKSRTMYSGLILCRSGEAYLETVVPHFEFMMSRCGYKKDFLDNKKYYPLYCRQSMESYYSNGGLRYLFEDKIDKVYSAVAECSLNSSFFADDVMKAFGYDANTFIKNSKLNYHEGDKERVEGSNQSYIGRLVFRHVGYIESYRRYLKNCKILTVDINKRITLAIEKYLTIYKNTAKPLHSLRQDSALDDLLGRVNRIKTSQFTDFNTRIETPDLQRK